MDPMLIGLLNFAAVIVGCAGILVLALNWERTPRWAKAALYTWIAVWLVPPLFRLWCAAAFS